MASVAVQQSPSLASPPSNPAPSPISVKKDELTVAISKTLQLAREDKLSKCTMQALRMLVDVDAVARKGVQSSRALVEQFGACCRVYGKLHYSPQDRETLKTALITQLQRLYQLAVCRDPSPRPSDGYYSGLIDTHPFLRSEPPLQRKSLQWKSPSSPPDAPALPPLSEPAAVSKRELPSAETQSSEEPTIQEPSSKKARTG